MGPNSRLKRRANILAMTAMRASYAAMIVAASAVTAKNPAGAIIRISPDLTALCNRFSIAPGVATMIT
jgi:hypothetical protein